MSRALNIEASQDDVRAICAKHGAGISAIETLPGGYTRVVLLNGDASAKIQRAFGSKVKTGPVARTPLSMVARGVPLSEAVPPVRQTAPVRR